MTPLELLRVARTVIGWLIRVLPAEQLREHLTETARQLDDAIADAAEEAKFGS